MLPWNREILGDWKLLRHFVDSGAHGSVASCCWGIFLCRIQSSKLSAPVNGSAPSTGRPWPRWRWFLRQCALAGLAAALLDVDHFIAAGAFSIAGATHLKVCIWPSRNHKRR